MNINFTCSNEFENALNSIPKEFREIEAIDSDSLDITKRYDAYHQGKRVKGEENANVGNTTNPNNREGVIFEPIRKLNSYRFLYEQIKEDYGIEVADESFKEWSAKPWWYRIFHGYADFPTPILRMPTKHMIIAERLNLVD